MKLKSMRAYLKPLKSSHFRQAIFAEAKKRMSGAYMNPVNREALAEAVFVVENDLEHRRGRDYPPVAVLRSIRNHLYDDLGWNESAKVMRVASMPSDTVSRVAINSKLKPRKEIEHA